VAVGVLLALCALAAAAQEKKAYDGEWLAQYPTRNGNRVLEAVVVLNAAGGTWRIEPPTVRSKNLCLGIDYPVTVTQDSGESLHLSVQASKALTGCRDLSVNLKRVDDRTLQGLIDDVRKVTLKRR
jgi:hypothetical protein